MIYVVVRDEDTGQSHYVRKGDVESGWKGGSQKIYLIGIDLEEMGLDHPFKDAPIVKDESGREWIDIRKMKKIFVLVVLVIVFPSSLFADSKEPEPLYYQKGFKVTAIKSGDWILDVYPEQITNMAPFRYIAFHDPNSIGAIPLKIEKGYGLIWRPITKVIFKYETNEKEYIAVSEYCFLIDSEEESGIRICEDYRYTGLPGVKGRFFTTPKNNVVMFVKFNFEVRPHRILSLEFTDLKVTGGD